MSILDVFSCAYGKGVAYELFSGNADVVKEVGEAQPKFYARVNRQRFQLYTNGFKECDGLFDVSYDTFTNKFVKIKERINVWGKRHSAEKKLFLKTFNLHEWSKRSIVEKKNSPIIAMSIVH